VQIRTREMHQRAEWGVAAHWAYKDGSPSPDIDWLNRIIDWQAEVSDPAQFMENLKTDLEQDEVFVFTPKGRVITLPVGSTPVDFAYAVHTEVGHACIGAKINGRLVSLDHQVHSGDTCEIFTSKVETAGPSQDWLGFVVSQRARNKIRQWFSRERRTDMIEAGRDELVDEMRRESLPVQRIWSSDQLAAVIKELSYQDLDALLAAVGEHHVSARSVAQKIAKGFRGGDAGEQLPSTVFSPRRQVSSDDSQGVHVEGLDDVLVRLAQLLHPHAGRRDHRVRHAGSRGERAPERLCQRLGAPVRSGRPHDRGRLGQRPPQRPVPLRRRGGRARPLTAAARRRQRLERPPRQHRVVRHAHR
jgi:GTP diphosphokinase / guanosine-3',5'-bis(diphosphate) 3'-diphosphatase